MPLITVQIRPWYKGYKYIKLSLSNLARTSKIFNKVFEDSLNKTVITLLIKIKELNVDEAIIGYNKNIKKSCS